MSSRKITIKLNEKDLVNVMQELGKFKASRNFWNRSVLQVTIDLTDSKETYEYLSKSKNILDWELGDTIIQDSEEDKSEELPKVVEQEIQVPKEEPKEEKKKPEKFVDYVSKFSGTTDWANLAVFIESSWRVAKKSPGVIFGTPLFKSSLLQEYEAIKNNGSSERILLGKVLEAYYNGVDYMDAVEDTIGKLRTSWKTLSKHESLTSVSIRLYKNT